MKVIAWSENLTQTIADEAAFKAGLSAGDFKAVSKTYLFQQSDVLSLHVVLSDRTRGLVAGEDLRRMKKTAFLINTSRGPLINESSLLNCLNQGDIRGAALDVYDVEPLPVDSPWRTTNWGEGGRSQVVLTPHSGYSYEGMLNDMWDNTRKNLDHLSRGEELDHMFF